MRKIFNTAIYAAAALTLAAACDTTEEALYPGTKGGMKTVTVSPSGEIEIDASGTAVTRTVDTNVPWTVRVISDANNNYKLVDNGKEVESVSREGNGEFTIKSGTNYNNDQRKGSIAVYNDVTGDTISIDVFQSKLQFIVPDDLGELFKEKIPETGGSVSFPLTITIPWIYNTENDTAWLQFNPAPSNNGVFEAKYKEFTATIEALPNYTTAERSATLQIYPNDTSETGPFQKLDEEELIREPFTITQEPGTLPANVSGSVVAGSINHYDAKYTLSYESKSPIVRCGVYVSGEGLTENTVYTAAAPDGGFPLSGSVTVDITGLTDFATYTVRPFVENMVGTTDGDNVSTFDTTRDPDNERFVGVSIVDGSVNVIPDVNSVSLSLTVRSDVELGSASMDITDINDNPIVTLICAVDKNNTGQQTLVFNSNEITNLTLTPNTEYKYTVTVTVDKVTDNRIQDKTDTVDGKFTTKTLPLGEGDNPEPGIK